jgi:dihydrolipoamide dehydrogenase
MAAPYDLVVVGSGPGGYVAAIRAAQLGLRTACVEYYPSLGGTCLNVGCIPSKALLDSSEHYHQAAHGLAVHGVEIGEVTLDLDTMMARKATVVKGLTDGVAFLFKKNEVDRIEGFGRIESPRRVVVKTASGEQALDTARVLIATGSKPTPLRTLPFDGERVVDSTDALALRRVPERLLVIGAGAVGLELGSVWRRLGAEVTVVEMLDQMLPWADGAIVRQLKRALEKQGIKIRLGTTAESAERTATGLRVTLRAGEKTETVETSVALVAVGRRPYTAGLGLEQLGITLDRAGRVPVNARFETSVPGIFAIGDVIAGPMLAHKAEEEGIAAVEGMAGKPVHVNYDAIPSVVYTFPELASVGITEEEARRRELPVATGAFPFSANGRARALGETEGAVKVIADARSDRILGLHILGPRASDMIAEAALAIEFAASAEDVARTTHAHPTLPEAVKEAALAVARRAIHI